MIIRLKPLFIKKEVDEMKVKLTEEQIRLRNKTILDSFFDEYARPPRKSEFLELGGFITYMQIQEGYDLFLKEYGYIAYGRGNIKTFEVYTLTNNGQEKVVFIGTKKEIINEFNLHNRGDFDSFYINKIPFANKYYFRRKLINLNKKYY